MQKKLTFSDDTFKDFSQGLELLNALGLSTDACFEPATLSDFLDPAKVKAFQFSYIK